MRGRTLWAAIATALAVSLCGCGVGSPVKVPSISTFPSPSGARGDTATFVVDGQRIVIAQSGRISTRIGNAPQLTYTGPLGCAGRYFTAHLTKHIEILFRYSSRDAYMLIGNSELHHFTAPPERRGHELLWDQTFGGRHIAVAVACPPPQ